MPYLYAVSFSTASIVVVPSFKVIVLGKLDVPCVPVVIATFEVESDTPSSAISDIALAASYFTLTEYPPIFISVP